MAKKITFVGDKIDNNLIIYKFAGLKLIPITLITLDEVNNVLIQKTVEKHRELKLKNFALKFIPDLNDKELIDKQVLGTNFIQLKFLVQELQQIHGTKDFVFSYTEDPNIATNDIACLLFDVELLEEQKINI